MDKTTTQQGLKELRGKRLAAEAVREDQNTKIFSVGYGGLNEVRDLEDIMNLHDIKFLLDVRSKPTTRRFSKKTLETMLGAGYMSRPVMGGFDHEIDEFENWRIRAQASLKEVTDMVDNGYKILIMCAEKNPDQCHRKYFVSRALEQEGFKVKHLIGPVQR